PRQSDTPAPAPDVFTAPPAAGRSPPPATSPDSKNETPALYCGAQYDGHTRAALDQSASELAQTMFPLTDTTIAADNSRTATAILEAGNRFAPSRTLESKNANPATGK